MGRWLCCVGVKMGINNLWEILRERGCTKECHISELRDMIKTDRCCVAIDTYIVYHKYFSIAWKRGVDGGVFDHERVIMLTVSMIDKMSKNLRSNGLDLIWCTDGDRDRDKLATDRRSEKHRDKITEIAKFHQMCTLFCEQDSSSYHDQAQLERYDFLREYWPEVPETPASASSEATPRLFDPDFNVASKFSEMKRELSKYPILSSESRRRLCDGLKALGHRFLRVPAISQGEKLCSIVVRMGLCQAVLSSDSDLIPMGTRCVIKEIKDDIATVYAYNDIITKLDFTHKQLVNLCIMLGNDYNDGIPGMGKVKCYKEVAENPSFDIHEFDRSWCGILRTNICIKIFTISRHEYNLVQQEVNHQLTS